MCYNNENKLGEIMSRADNYYHSSCPVIREGLTDCAQRLHVGSNTISFVPFLENILWLRESEAQVSYWHGNKMLKEGSTCGDYYGYLTSLKSAVEDAQESKETYSVDENSSLEIRVYCAIEEIPVTYTPNDHDLGQKKAYNIISHDKFWFHNEPTILNKYLEVMNSSSDFQSRHEAYDKIEHLLIQRKIIAKEILVWSSKNSLEENNKLLNHVINKFAINEEETNKIKTKLKLI